MDKVLIILLSILIGFIILLVQFFLQSGGLKTIKISNKSPYYKPSFIICGANNSGKTALFYRLINNSNTTQDDDDEKKSEKKITTTVSSIEPNFGEIKLPIATPSIGKSFQLVDYPGHLKYWNLFTKLIKNDITLSNIKGIIVVIDSSSTNWAAKSNSSSGSKSSTASTASVSGEVEKITKFLYNLLAITERKHNGIDFLFAINKGDLFDSLPIHKIQSILELEIDKLIHNEINNVDKTSGIDLVDEVDESAESSGNRNDGGGSGGGGGSGSGGDAGYRENLREFWLSIIGSEQGHFTFDKLEGNMDFMSGSVLKNKIDKWECWFDEKVVNT